MADITVFEEIRERNSYKSCADCRWCQLDTMFKDEYTQKLYAKCQHPRGDVTGMGLGIDNYCSIERSNDHIQKCGQKARYFEKKPDPEPEEEAPRKVWGKVRKLWRGGREV